MRNSTRNRRTSSHCNRSTATQQRKHTNSCRKGKVECRFNFPRPISNTTFIIIPSSDINTDQTIEEENANIILTKLKEIINDENIHNMTTTKIFQTLNFIQKTNRKSSQNTFKKNNYYLKT